MTAPSTTQASAPASHALTTIAISSIFTPPTACATSWTYEPPVYNNVEPSGLLIQNCETVVSSCFPSSFADAGRQTASLIYSPGYCPRGYTSADLAVDGPKTTAICCYSDFSYTTSTMLYSNLDPAIFAGCTSTLASFSSTIVSARASESSESTMVQGPIIMWAQPITVQLQSSDLSLFLSSGSSTSSVGPTSTVSTPNLTTSTISLSPTSLTSQPAQASPTLGSSTSTGLSAAAKGGIGAGIGVGVLAVFAIFGWLFLRRRKMKSNTIAMMAPDHANQFPSNTVPVAGSARKYEPAAELDTSQAEKSRNQVSELQG